MYGSNTATTARWDGSLPAPSTAGAPRRGVLTGAFALLSALQRAEDAGLTALASACGLPKTTAYRLLEQLSDLGAVENRQGRYRIGPHLFRLGHGWQPCPELRPAARRPSRRLASVTGTTVGLAVLYQGQTMTLDWTTALDVTPPPVNDRSVWPWYTAAGKVLVALSGPELPLGPLPGTWPGEAAAIREHGAAFDREEVLEGVCCTAVPVPARSGPPVAALCVLTDPEHRLDRLAEAARRTAAAIGAALGHRR
ncbi:IclR family transcriptional regulator [Streptomyces chrestomyceticus]|uniref:IclR family transcriptional regulator n=1 Tax=Streptomyces chrestomyceticus TaxID=68185 RepID=UPI0036C73DAC